MEKHIQELFGIFRYDANLVPLEIEILPKALQTSDYGVLKDGHCIGVPKPLLVKAFVTTKSSLFAHIDGVQINPDRLHEATAIMLLFDPEHLTAANARKRLLQQTHKNNNENDFKQTLQRELWLLDSFLTSPLNKHTKSPTLWNHRRWLVSTYWTVLLPKDQVAGASEAARTFCDHEIGVVMKAGARHPKNYYAWDYARKVFGMAVEHSSMTAIASGPDSVIDKVRCWCLQHISDISGWTFLIFLLREVKNPEVSATVVFLITEAILELRFAGEAINTVMWAAVHGCCYMTKHDRSSIEESIRDAGRDLLNAADGDMISGMRRLGETRGKENLVTHSMSNTWLEQLNKMIGWVEKCS